MFNVGDIVTLKGGLSENKRKHVNKQCFLFRKSKNSKYALVLEIIDDRQMFIVPCINLGKQSLNIDLAQKSNYPYEYFVQSKNNNFAVFIKEKFKVNSEYFSETNYGRIDNKELVVQYISKVSTYVAVRERKKTEQDIEIEKLIHRHKIAVMNNDLRTMKMIENKIGAEKIYGKGKQRGEKASPVTNTNPKPYEGGSFSSK